MSLPAPYSEVYREGDGVTTEFSFGNEFKAISQNYVKCIVYLEDGYAVVPTYTVNLAVGSITISALTMPDSTVLTAPPLGSQVRIFRDVPEAQTVNASQIQSYTGKQLENVFDAIVAMIQEVSYTVDHKTVRLTEPQRDIALQELSELADNHLIYWDFTNRKLVVTNYPQQDVVRCVNGLFFRLRTDPDTQQPYLQWSTDNSDWHSINVDAAYALAQDAYNLADSAYNLASTTRGELNAHKANHLNPHETSMTNLIDTNLTGLTSGQFLQFNGLNWVNVDYNTTVTWGGIIGNIDNQPDLKNALDAKVNLDGSSIMTGPLKMRASSSFQCAIAPFWDGVGFYKLNSDDSVTLIASIETPDGFVPWTTNTYNIGSSLKKWKNLYLGEKLFVSTINNGGDLVVPAVSGTLATKADVDLAANSGRMITDQGVWFAKMYAATVVPTGAEYDGKNYADFSQVDAENNPVIKIYTGASGAWTLSETITPPAEYDGYVPITSKIWDIAEQSGQQGGRVLWNHTSQEFTPYPTIISFENIEITGDSTVIMPLNPSGNQIVNKDYVDNHIPTGLSTYHPTLFAHEWDDKLRYDVQWLRADTFSWQDGTVYEAAFQHLQDDMNSIEPHGVHPCFYATAADQTAQTNQFMYYTAGYVAGAAHPYCYVTWDSPNVQIVYADVIAGVGDAGSTLYNGSGVSATSVGTIYSAGTTISGRICEFLVETVAGTNIVYYVAQDGHKFCRPSQENNIETIYAATGVAWYYIYDYDNTRFKLPRTKFGVTGLRDTVGNYVEPGIPNLTGEFYNKYNNVNVLFGPQTTTSGVFKFRATGSSQVLTNSSSALSGTGVMGIDASQASSVYNNSDTVQPPATQMYLYFYVGAFTQTALENTAGINASLFNGKADIDLANVLANIDFVVERQEPTAQNNYTWYRKYRSGWVEQGGKANQPNTTDDTGATISISLPVEMADNNYAVLTTGSVIIENVTSGGWAGMRKDSNSTTTTLIIKSNRTISSIVFNWEVKGMAA